jgi:hypothetical protein
MTIQLPKDSSCQSAVMVQTTARIRRQHGEYTAYGEDGPLIGQKPTSSGENTRPSGDMFSLQLTDAGVAKGRLSGGKLVTSSARPTVHHKMSIPQLPLGWSEHIGLLFFSLQLYFSHSSLHSSYWSSLLL